MVRRWAIQSGDGPTRTPRKADTVKRPHRAGVAMAALATLAVVAGPSGEAISGERSPTPQRVARSRATPAIDQASGRFPSMEISSTTSALMPRASVSFLPMTGVMRSSSNSSPSWSSLRRSSRAEQSMPLETTPRILRSAITNPPGSTAPTGASGTWLPRAKLVAPQTMSRGPLPVSTVTRRTRSAPSMALIASMRTTTTSSRPSPTCSTPSTTRPRSSIVAVSSSREGKSTNVASHDRGIFMRTALRIERHFQ